MVDSGECQLRVGLERSDCSCRAADLEGDIIEDLRTPKSAATSVTFASGARHSARGLTLAPLLNNLSLAGTYTSGMARTEYENGRASNFTVGLDYNLSRALLPELSRWAPAELHVTSVYTRGSDNRLTYLKPAEAIDDIPREIAGLTQHLAQRNVASSCGRRSRCPADSISTRCATCAATATTRRSASLTGSDRVQIPWCRCGVSSASARCRRDSTTLLRSTSWIQAPLDFGSSYNMLRDPNTLSFLRIEDSPRSMQLPRRLGSSQTTTAGVTLDLPRAAKMYLDSTGIAASAVHGDSANRRQLQSKHHFGVRSDSVVGADVVSARVRRGRNVQGDWRHACNERGTDQSALGESHDRYCRSARASRIAISSSARATGLAVSTIRRL